MENYTKLKMILNLLGGDGDKFHEQSKVVQVGGRR